LPETERVAGLPDAEDTDTDPGAIPLLAPGCMNSRTWSPLSPTGP
jgi:hypothetical protein